MYSKQIENIMQRFDFKKTLKVMRAIDWEYFNPKTNDGSTIPVTLDRIKETAKRNLETLAAEPESSCVESGGFRASWLNDYSGVENRGKELNLEFILEDKAGFDSY